jgi:hypothetical protein
MPEVKNRKVKSRIYLDSGQGTWKRLFPCLEKLHTQTSSHTDKV